MVLKFYLCKTPNKQTNKTTTNYIDWQTGQSVAEGRRRREGGETISGREHSSLPWLWQWFPACTHQTLGLHTLRQHMQFLEGRLWEHLLINSMFPFKFSIVLDYPPLTQWLECLTQDGQGNGLLSISSPPQNQLTKYKTVPLSHGLDGWEPAVCRSSGVNEKAELISTYTISHSSSHSPQPP